MVDRKRTPPTRTPPTRTPPTRSRGNFSPVRGDLMDRARGSLRGARDAVATRTPPSGGRPTGGGPGQGAIDFGRSMTGMDGPIQQVKNDIVKGVAEHLASKGIYQDDRGTWQIAGLERNDPSISIRDSAVRAMGGPSWEKIVGDADARLGANNIGLPSASPITRGGGPGMPTAPVPQTRTTSGTPTIPGRTLPPLPSIPGAGPGSTRLPTPGGIVYGDKPMTGPTPRPPYTPGGAPVVPGSGPSSSRPLTPGGITPATGSQVSPTQYPRTAPQPGLGGTLGIPPGRGGTISQTPTTGGAIDDSIYGRAMPSDWPQSGRGPQSGSQQQTMGLPPGVTWDDVMREPAAQSDYPDWNRAIADAAAKKGVPGPIYENTTAAQPLPQNTTNWGQAINQMATQFPQTGYHNPNAGPPVQYQGYQQPISPSNQGRTDVGGVGQGTPPTSYPPPTGGIAPASQSQFPGGPQTPYPQAQPGQPTPGGMPGNAPGGGVAPQAPAQQAPISPITAGNQVIPAGNTVSRGTTPAPQSQVPQPPARPQPGPVRQPGGQVGGTFPNGQVFGSNQGSPFGPDFPFGPGGFQARTGGRDLSTLGADIAARVQAGIAGGNRGGMPGQGGLQGLQGLGDRIAQQVQGQIAGNRANNLPGLQPGGVGTSIAEIMQRVQGQLAQSRLPGGRPDMTMPGPGQPTTGGTTLPGGTTVARGPAPTGSAQMTGAATQIIRQETGGADLTGQTNCTIRPEAGCLALNSGIFESTARSMGLDFNQIVNDPVYAQKAVEQLLGSYVNEDAGGWTGHVGQTVWEYGEANLPGGGMEAVARYYFGGCATNGCFTDEQGRSVDTYGQQFMEKMGQQAPIQPTGGPTTTNIGQAPTANPIGQGGAPNGGTLGLPTSAPASIGTGAGPQGQQTMNFQFPIQEVPQIPLVPGPPPGAPNPGQVVPGTGPAQGTTPGAVVAGPGGLNPSNLPLDTMTPAIVINGNLRSSEGPNTEPVIEANPQTTDWMNLLYPGASSTFLNNPSGKYGFKAQSDQVGDIYCNYWDWNCGAHTGTDIPTNGSAPYKALQSGKVVCAGAGSNSAADTTRSGYQCSSYEDYGPDNTRGTADDGIGNLTIQADSGAQITYGHTRSTPYKVGDQVDMGADLGMSGTENGYHVHVEVRLPIASDGGYVLVDPDAYFNDYYCPRFCASNQAPQ